MGVYKTYTEENLRYSQNAPLTMYEEVNTRCNLPAQIDIEATEGDEYKFLCVVKGGGHPAAQYAADAGENQPFDKGARLLQKLPQARAPIHHLSPPRNSRRYYSMKRNFFPPLYGFFSETCYTTT